MKKWALTLNNAKEKLIFHDYKRGLPLLVKAANQLLETAEEKELLVGLAAIFDTTAVALQNPACPLNKSVRTIIKLIRKLNEFASLLEDPSTAHFVILAIDYAVNLLNVAQSKNLSVS